jgi:hypothetical protein
MKFEFTINPKCGKTSFALANLLEEVANLSPEQAKKLLSGYCRYTFYRGAGGDMGEITLSSLLAGGSVGGGEVSDSAMEALTGYLASLGDKLPRWIDASVVAKRVFGPKLAEILTENHLVAEKNLFTEAFGASLEGLSPEAIGIALVESGVVRAKKKTVTRGESEF